VLRHRRRLCSLFLIIASASAALAADTLTSTASAHARRHARTRHTGSRCGTRGTRSLRHHVASRRVRVHMRRNCVLALRSHRSRGRSYAAPSGSKPPHGGEGGGGGHHGPGTEHQLPAPSVAVLSPVSGPEAGGTLVTVTGTNFAGVSAVHFGGVIALSFAVVSSTTLTAVSPPGSGTQNVTVTTTAGTSPLTAADGFLYVPAWEGIPGATWEGFSAQNPLPGNKRFGSELSPFNMPVGSSPTLANSAAMVSYLLEHEGIPADHRRPAEGSRPMFYASNSDPVLTIEGNDGAGTLHLNGRRIHVPTFATPEKESDGHLTIVLAPVDALMGGETIDFWQASIGEGKIKASAVGAVQMGPTGSLLDEEGGGTGDAAYFALQAGLVRAPELRAGAVNHALTAVVKGVSTKVVYPARVGDGSSTDPNAPPMGQRFVLDYTFPEIESLGFKPWKIALLKALITYGFYVGDSSNERLVLVWEGSSTYPGVSPEPFEAIGTEQGLPYSGGQYEFNLAEGIDWSRLRAVAPPAG
jgi:IPT/TIG domain